MHRVNYSYCIQMTYDDTEIELEDFTVGNVTAIGSHRATVAGRRVIVKFVAGTAVSLHVSGR